MCRVTVALFTLSLSKGKRRNFYPRGLNYQKFAMHLPFLVCLVQEVVRMATKEK